MILIPTYNEASNVEAFIPIVLAACEADLIVLDDASPDGTGQLVDAIAAVEPRVSIVHRPRKLGLGPAYLDGFEVALARGYQRIFQMDADGSHSPSVIASLDAALDGADLAVGSRYIRGGGVQDWSLFRRLVSRGGSIYSRALLGLPVQDATSGCKGWRSDLLRRVDRDSVPANGYVFQVEMTHRALRAGARVVEVPLVFIDRAAGRSKFSMRIIVEAAVRVAVLSLARLPKVRPPWRRRSRA